MSEEPKRRKNWFSDQMSHHVPDNQIAHELVQFERERLKWLLTRFKLKHHIARLIRYCESETGTAALRFSAFNDCFPTFPFVIGCTRLQRVPMPGRVRKGGQPKLTPLDYHIHRDPASTEPARFKQFQAVPFVGAYQTFYNEAAKHANGRAIALIFPRRGFLHGMVMHNDASEQYWSEGLSWVYKVPSTENKLYVRPLSALVEDIYDGGRGWRPPGD